MVSSTNQSSSKKKSLPTNDNKIKTEAENDEIKIFSASSILKNEPDADIEDRLSPVVEEPTSPNRINTVNNNVSGLYTFPFLYPYFMTAAAQANASNLLTVNTSADGHTNNLFGSVPMSSFPFPGMPFAPEMMNPSFAPNFFNPFGGIPVSSNQSSVPSRNVHISHEKIRSKKPHIKKPLNAFMIYMKEQRVHIVEESALKESSAINKYLGQKWKELPRSEQDKYYVLAKEERNRHLQMYPNWSARDNYGLKKKRQSVVIEKKLPQKNKNSVQYENDPKKCRARFGLEGVNQWCKHCRRKKKCTRFLEDDPITTNQRTLSNTVSSPDATQSDNDDILSRQIDSIEDDHNDSNEENKQQFQLKPSTLPSYFAPNFLY
ncbi:unnamed protein product [Adineta steineri]|uniref:HMG box domain-containing protein n=1 Tax=Adineta steineri TaxID=433720 RepID=A0A815CQF2_9BILA|nr:unnamed protein product [Adineta steineri]CAF1286842.1 unnamed protein product [Adineta steineri]